MNPFLLMICGILGLGIGSFLNVLSMRYDPDRSVFTRDVFVGRSMCPSCKKTLRWYELVPLLSFLVQRAKCRRCRAKLSWQYPVVELVTALLFVAVPLRLGELLSYNARALTGGLEYFYYSLALWLGLTAILVLISLIDLKERIIPDELNIAIVILGLVYIAMQFMTDNFGALDGSILRKYAILAGYRSDIFINHLLAAGVAIAFFGALIVFSRGRAMGMGDLKLSAALGVFLGWPDLILALALAFISGSLWSGIYLIRRTKSMKDAVPFAPFIVAGVFLAFFAGEELLDMYFNIFSLL